MMPVSLRLAIRQWHARALRPILCSLAIAAAVALVLCVGVLFDSVKASLETGISQILGSSDLHVRPKGRGKAFARYISAETFESIKKKPEIAMISGRLDDLAISIKTDKETRWWKAIGVYPALDQQLRPKKIQGGRFLSEEADGKEKEIVVDAIIAQMMSLKVGDQVAFNGEWDQPVQAAIVGVIERPQVELVTTPSVYVPMAMITTDVGQPVQYKVLDIKLKDSSQANAFAAALKEELGPDTEVTTEAMRQGRLARTLEGFNLGLAALSMVAILCAALIIGTTLSVGVQERIRQFGQLRCIGASRFQLMQLLLADALMLMVVGTSAGLILGGVLATLVVQYYPHIFLTISFTRTAFIFAIANGVLATLFGSLIPMFQVARVSPMEAVRTAGKAAQQRGVWLAGLGGLAALGLQALLWQIPHKDFRIYAFIALGVPLIFGGYCLLGPSLLALTERVAATLIGKVFFVRPEMLRAAWSKTPWRAGAMVSALMIGVTLFTVVQQRSNIVLQNWEFPTRFPDLFMYSFSDFSQTRFDNMRKRVPEIAEASSISLAPVKMLAPEFGVKGLFSYDQTTFVAIEPESFRKMIDITFIEGDPDTAWHLLETGDHILVAGEFTNAHNLHVGDVLPIIAANGSRVEFKIAGVIKSPGMELARNYFDMGGAVTDASVSSVMGSLTDGEKYFKIRGGKVILADVQKGLNPSDVNERIRPRLSAMGFESISAFGMKESIHTLILRVVRAFSMVSIGALVVASLGVANMVIASTHARRFEFGVLRAIGAGRGQLVRLVLAETTMVSLTAGILGSLTGLHYAFMATRVDHTIIGFATKFLITFGPLALGIFITLFLGWLAAIVPAIRAATAAQRTLLAAGRS